MKTILLMLILVPAFCFARVVPQTGWPTPTGADGAQHYSSIDQITPKNVASLKQAWVYHTGDVSTKVKTASPTTFEATPILFKKNLFFCTPFSRVIALNPKTGKKIWSFNPKIPLDIRYSQGYMICRGVAAWQNKKASKAKACQSRIITATQDGRLIALSARTGKPCKDFGNNGEVLLNKGLITKIPTSKDKEYGITPALRKLLNHYYAVGYTSAPAVIGNEVIVGMAIGDNGYQAITDGLLRAYSTITGKLLWEFDPIPKELREKTGAANVWAPITVSPSENRIYIATTSPSNDYYGGNRLRPVPYGDAVVALNASTGKPIWHYQIVRHDLFDYDLPAQPTLVTIKKNGKEIPALVQATKMGFVFVLNRNTGKPIYSVVAKPVPKSTIPGNPASPTQLFPSKAFRLLNDRTFSARNAWGITPLDRWMCRRELKGLRSDGMFAPASLHGSILFPFTGGGVNWGGVTIDPNNNVLVVNNSAMAQKIKLVPRKLANKIGYTKATDGPGLNLSPSFGSPYALMRKLILSPLGMPCNAPPWGNLTAINLNTGKRLWQIPFGSVRKFKFFTSPKKWGSPNTGGSLVTASGVVFIGASMDSEFHAYDLKTGKLLFEARLPANGNAVPMTYKVDGKQYVVIAAGGGMGATRAMLGDSLVAYALDP